MNGWKFEILDDERIAVLCDLAVCNLANAKDFAKRTVPAFAVAVAISAVLAATPASAGYLVANDESFSYVGTVTAPDGSVYAIPSFVSTPGTTTYPGRDASIYASSNAPTADTGAGYESYTQFGTNWYSSLNGLNDGNNPQDNNTGFVQLLDASNANVSSASGGWTDLSNTKFSIAITGGAAAPDPTDLYNRLWSAPEVGGPGFFTAGWFQNYTLTLTANFASGDVTEESSGWYSTTAAPTSVTGSFTGSFLNDSANSALNGLYAFDFTFSDVNWASANGIPDVYGSYFGASEPAPEPTSMAIAGVGLAGLGLIRRRKRA